MSHSLMDVHSETERSVNSIKVVNMNENELEKLKRMLSNVNLLRWTNKHGADKLTTKVDAIGHTLSLDTNEDSVMLMDTNNVKAIITDSKYDGEVHSRYDIMQLKDIISTLVKDKDIEGTIVISNKPESPMILELGRDVIILAPRTDTDKMVKAKDVVKEKEDETDTKKDSEGRVIDEDMPNDEEFEGDVNAEEE